MSLVQKFKGPAIRRIEFQQLCPVFGQALNELSLTLPQEIVPCANEALDEPEPLVAAFPWTLI